MEFLIGSLRMAGGIFAISILAFLLIGIARGARRSVGASVGTFSNWLHSPLFYIAASAVFFGICVLIWIPLPKIPFANEFTILGAVLCFPGLAFALWGRLALGDMYFVSTGFGAQLFSGHQLITRGPYAIVRHPMYFGLILAAFGSLLLYQTWTAVFLAVCSLGLIRRAWREEELLAKEFGTEWVEYCRRVPLILPRLFIRGGNHG